MTFADCPKCGAGYPDFHSPEGSIETICDSCGWSSDAAPTPPENVRVVLDDDTEVPLDCVYDGLDEDVHRWLIPVPDDCWGRVTDVKIDVFPARTGVRLVREEWVRGV